LIDVIIKQSLLERAGGTVLYRKVIDYNKLLQQAVETSRYLPLYALD
jgi:hypothetical protein